MKVKQVKQVKHMTPHELRTELEEVYNLKGLEQFTTEQLKDYLIQCRETRELKR